MRFLDHLHFFERQDDRFVYRPTVFSKGFTVSADEKDRLLVRLKRLDRRFLLEGFALVALIAVLAMAGIAPGTDPIVWFVFASIASVGLLALTFLRRKRRLIDATLGRRTPDLPRMPFRQALMQPRPALPKRYALPVMRSLIGLFLLAIIVSDALALYPILAALRAGGNATGPVEHETIAEILSLTLYNGDYWLVVALINVVLLAAVGLLCWELRRWRMLPDFDAPPTGSKSS
jgi:hypothetical protein